MIVKILGILDILAAVIFFFSFYFNINTALLIVALYLIVKGAVFLFSKDIASALDILVGFLIIWSMNNILPKIVNILIIIYLLQKGVFSLM